MTEPRINTDPHSACYFDHAPRGTSRAEYVELRKWLAEQFGEGEPIDATFLHDDHIALVQRACVRLRRDDKPTKGLA